jgi:hypothetical protein
LGGTFLWIELKLRMTISNPRRSRMNVGFIQNQNGRQAVLDIATYICALRMQKSNGYCYSA